MNTATWQIAAQRAVFWGPLPDSKRYLDWMAKTKASKPAKKTVLKPMDFACSRCGSTNVARDAWAAWDAPSQEWKLSSVFDYAHCEACGEETSLKEVR